ncbi:MAG: hypothetical protein ABIX01_11010 [Chitinophagaceae bacterium]
MTSSLLQKTISFVIMETIEANESKAGTSNLTKKELTALIQASPIIKEKMEEGKRFISKLMEKYPDLEDRLNGKVPHP